MLKTIAALICIGSVCGGLLAWTHAVTQPVIENNRLQYTTALAGNLLGEDLPESFDPTSRIAGTCSTWLLSEIRAQGYAGEIVFLGLWRNAATPTASLRTVKHAETPGIGDFIDQAKDDWIVTLDGVTHARLTDIDRMTGATITHKAVLRAFNDVFTRAAERCQ